nr:ribonuclease H-like domain-containing protein [Tanacetum cinerariifolium]
MTPSSPSSKTFLDPTPSPILNTIASATIMTQPNNTAILYVKPNTPYGPISQGPTHTDPSPLPQSTFPTLIAHNHASGPSNSAHQTSQLPPPTFDFPNPQPNTKTVHEPPRTHPMITRSQSCIVKPIDRLSLHTSSISPISKNPSHALKDPNWRNAISQQLGVDFDETFSPVVKSATIRTVLSLVVSRQWPIHQLDVKNDFLNALLQHIIGSLNNEFDMTNLRALNFFLGISADRIPTGLVSNFIASQVARLSKFEADFKQQQSEMTNKINTVLKAITDRLAGSLPSDTVKNLKLNINSTTSVLSARSYLTEDPLCSTHIHGSINTIMIHPKQQNDSHDDKPAESEEEEKDSPKDNNTNPSASPDSSVSFIAEKVIFDEKKLRSS